MQEITKEILLKAKRDVFSSNMGSHITLFKGEGIDFDEIKEYNIGDDIRKINWNATAKSADGSLQINQFNDERELNIIIAFMVSGNIYFGSVELKQYIMAYIVAMLGYSAVKNNDRYQTIFFDENVAKEYTPTRSSGVLEDIVNYAVELNPLQKNISWEHFCYYINSLKKRSLIFIIGDFLEDNINLSTITAKNEIYVLVVRDKLEEDISKLKGEFDLIDPMSLQTVNQTINSGVGSNYKALLKQHDDALFEHFINYKIKYTKIYTDDDIFLKLSELLC